MSSIRMKVLTVFTCAGAILPLFAEQPDKWVSYVESTGSQWVDTGIIGRPNTKIEAKVEWVTTNDSAFVACGLYSNNTRFYMCYCENGNGNMIVSQRTNSKVLLSNEWETRWEKNRVYNYTAVFSATNSAGESTATVAVDGIGPWSKTFTGLNTGRTLYVFANNSADGTVGGRSKTRCYGLKIYQGPEDGGDMVLVRDFQPGIKDGKPGLYDAKNDVFYSSISGTELVCDENSEVPDEYIEYVESQGVAAQADGQKPAYIDTGIIGRSGTKVIGEFAILKSEDNSILDSRKGDNRFYMLHSYNSKMTCGYGTHKDNSMTLTLGKKYWVETELNAGSQIQKIGADGVTNTVYSASDTTAIDTGYSLYLFAINKNGQPDWYSKARCYGFEIWQDGQKVRDFKPCLKNGVAGLYDDVSKRIFYSLGTPLVFNNVHRQSVKPKEVVFVEYIESDGNNTLDTGVPARTGTRAKGVMMWTAEDENGGGKTRIWNRENHRYLENTAAVFWRNKRAYLGARDLKNANLWFHMLHESDAVLLSQYGNSDEMHLQNGGVDVPAYVGVTNSFDVTFADGSQTMEWNGVQVLNTNIAGTVDTGNNLCLFSSSHWRWRSQARCYGLEIWQGGVKVRDFKPCKVNGKGMLYDTVTESIYRPSPDIPESRIGKVIFPEDATKLDCYVDWVETDGMVFIDTGVIGKSGTTAEFKETSMQKASNVEEAFLASYGGSSDAVSRFYMWYHAWGCNVGLGYGTYYRPKKNDPYTDAENSADPDVYTLNSGVTTHARVSFAVGAQTFHAIDDATGTETLYSSKTSSTNVDTGRTLYLFAKHDSDAGTPTSPAASRFYFLKIWQGDANGENMQLVRNFRPVKLTNGLVVLWDFVEKKPYVPKSTTSPYYDTTFPVAGPDGDLIRAGLWIIIR